MIQQTAVHEPTTDLSHISKPTPETDLERAADALLAQHSAIGRGSGIYSEAQLNRKMRSERRQLPLLTEGDVSSETADVLLERRIEELVDAAGLNALQEIIYRLHIAGFGRRRMASALGITYSLLNRRLTTVERKVKAALRQSKYAGWYVVYLSEVNRPAYRRRR